MTEKTYREALTDALFLEMRRDENVFVMGEDVVGGTGSPHAEPGFVGGVFGVTGGFSGLLANGFKSQYGVETGWMLFFLTTSLLTVPSLLLLLYYRKAHKDASSL